MSSLSASAPTRIERDSMGELAVPVAALYAAQTQRAVDNFRISGQRMPVRFIDALLRIKQAAAKVNAGLGVLDAEVAQAIDGAVAHLLVQSSDERMAHFPLDVFQTGSGTSTNMNANEVIATLAARALGRPVSANDQVNASRAATMRSRPRCTCRPRSPCTKRCCPRSTIWCRRPAPRRAASTAL